MTTIRLTGRGVVGGKAAGEAVVTGVPLCFRTEYNPATGEVIGLRHPLRGQSLKGKVLVFPSTKGSCGNSVAFTTGCREGNAPVAMICTRREPLAVLSCVVNGIPMVSDLEQNPVEVVASGDYLVVDGDAGIVTVTKKAAGRPAGQQVAEKLGFAQAAQKGPGARRSRVPIRRMGARREAYLAGYPF